MDFTFEFQLYSFLGLKSLLGVIVATLLVFHGLEGVMINSHPNQHAVLTILSENGDMIDCVNIYKQPAFDHPLLKNHTVKMLPSFLPTTTKGNNSSRLCPEETIPILRAPATNLTAIVNGEFSYCKVEVARLEMYLKKGDGSYLGASGTISAWNIHVEEREWSLNSVTVFNEEGSFLEIGWVASPVLFEDVKPRIFVNWLDRTRDYGCFNLRCPGFIHVSRRVMLGTPLPNVSEYDGQQFDYEFAIFKDATQGKWWAVYGGEALGYWPANLFVNFGELVYANWGGSVCNSRFHGSHTNTEMGSGAFATYQYGRASYVRRILIMNTNRKFVSANHLFLTVKCDKCYSAQGCFKFVHDEGDCVHYGGPGGRFCDSKCKEA